LPTQRPRHVRAAVTCSDAYATGLINSTVFQLRLILDSTAAADDFDGDLQIE
jgi:hypothetical protein